MIGITSTSNTSRTGLLVGSVLLTFSRGAGAYYGFRWPGSSSTTRELNHLSKKPRFRLIELIAG